MKPMARCVNFLSLPLLLAVVASAVLLSGCGAASKSELKVGGLYSVDDGEGSFHVVKILVLDESAAHIAVYANKFPARPTTIDPSALTFGSIDDEKAEDENIGVMHLPLSRETFMQDQPVFITQTSVTEAELEGYHMWKEAGGEVFR